MKLRNLRLSYGKVSESIKQGKKQTKQGERAKEDIVTGKYSHGLIYRGEEGSVAQTIQQFVHS
jgi:hypothetical protein